MSSPYARVPASPLLHFVLSRPAPATVQVEVSGEIDLATAPDLIDRLLNVIHDQKPAVLEVDLLDVSFLACVGISALVCVRAAAAHAGCQMWVTRPQPIVRLVLEHTGLLSVFTAPAVVSAAEPSRSAIPQARGALIPTSLTVEDTLAA